MIIALKAGCMVDNFPFANTRREAAIFYISRIITDLALVSLFFTRKALGMSCRQGANEQTKNEKRNEMVRQRFSSVVVFQIFFCFFLFQGTASDSSSQTDTNTVVGKPKLGKKGNKIYRS